MSNKRNAPTASKVAEDINNLMNESQFLNDYPKPKKAQKRQRAGKNNEGDIFFVNRNNAKAKAEENTENCDVAGFLRKKLRNVTGVHLEARKQRNDQLLNSLSEIIAQLEADFSIMKDNEQMLERLNGAVMKCIQQATLATKQKLRTLKEIHASFKKGCEDLDQENRAETGKLVDELENDIQNLRQKLISETKRSGWENLRRTIFAAIDENDF